MVRALRSRTRRHPRPRSGSPSGFEVLMQNVWGLLERSEPNPSFESRTRTTTSTRTTRGVPQHTPNAKRARLPRSIMQAHRSIHVGVWLCRIEEKLDATAWLLPLITDHGLHHVALWFFIPG